MNNLNKGIAPLAIVFVVAVILALGGGGYYIAQKLPKQTDTPTESGEMADWKTYSNSKFGYSFRYPANWFLRESSDKSSLNFSKSELVQNDPRAATEMFANFSVSDFNLNFKEGNPARLVSPQKFFNFYYPADEGKNYMHGTSLVREWVTIAGIPVFYHYAVGADSRYPFDQRYVMYTQNKQYNFVLYAGTVQQPTTYEQKDDDLIRRVIGTLSLSDKSVKFINAGLDEIASWKTYTSTVYGFQFNYPDNEKVVLVDGTFKNNVGQKTISVQTRVSSEDSNVTCLQGVDTRCSNVTTIDGHNIVVQFVLSGNVVAHVLQQSNKSALLSLSCDSITTGMTGKNDYCVISDERVSMFKKLLSTFRFINAQSTELKIFSVSPVLGKAPLTVTTTAFDGCHSQLTWGDNTDTWYSGYAMQSCGAGITHPMISKTHTYTAPGIYTISLYLNPPPANSVSTAIVTVTP